MNYNDEIWDTPSHLRRRTLTRAYLLGFVIFTLFFATLGIQYINLQENKSKIIMEEELVSFSVVMMVWSKEEKEGEEKEGIEILEVFEIVSLTVIEGEENMIEQAIAKITAQQTDETSMAYMVGEQLKDICRRNPKDAELIFHDLDVEEMSLIHAEKQISAYADEHRKSAKFFCVTPKVAEGILRSFYGLSVHENDTGGTWTSHEPVGSASTIDDFPLISQGKAVSVSLDDFF